MLLQRFDLFFEQVYMFLCFIKYNPAETKAINYN